jgi:NADP-dependent aldehyde dehydrogenase
VGQFCTNPGLAVALESEQLDRFVTALAKLIQDTDPGTMLLENILGSYEKGVEDLSGTSGVEVVARSGGSADRRKTQAAAALFLTDADTFLANPRLSCEVFGPSTMVVRCRDRQQMLAVAGRLEGQLTCTVHATEEELSDEAELLAILETKAGRVLSNGFPTGVEVCPAMNHGGPYPATTDVHFTSVGTAAIYRFARPICYQGFPQSRLPPELQDRNVRGIWRMVDHQLTRDDLT